MLEATDPAPRLIMLVAPPIATFVTKLLPSNSFLSLTAC